MIAKNDNSWTWPVAQLLGFGDAMFEVPSGFLAAAKLPEEFTARRLTKLVPKPLASGQPQIVLVPWLGHHFRAVSGELRIRASTVVTFAPATPETVRAVREEWDPSVVKPATEAQAPAEATRLRGFLAGHSD